MVERRAFGNLPGLGMLDTTKVTEGDRQEMRLKKHART